MNSSVGIAGVALVFICCLTFQTTRNSGARVPIARSFEQSRIKNCISLGNNQIATQNQLGLPAIRRVSTLATVHWKLTGRGIGFAFEPANARTAPQIDGHRNQFAIATAQDNQLLQNRSQAASGYPASTNGANGNIFGRYRAQRGLRNVEIAANAPQAAATTHKAFVVPSNAPTAPASFTSPAPIALDLKRLGIPKTIIMNRAATTAKNRVPWE